MSFATALVKTHGSEQKRAAGKIFLSLFAALVLAFAPLTAQAAEKRVIDSGHTDGFYVDITGAKPRVMIRNGIRNDLYNMDSTEIHIADYSYVLSQHCQDDYFAYFDNSYLPQLGEAGKNGYYGACGDASAAPGMSAPGQEELGATVQIQFTKVEGPGKISFYNNNQMAEAEDGSDAILPFMENGNFYIEAGDVLKIPGHQHGHWYFEYAGYYHLTGRAIVTKKDGSRSVSDPFTLTYRVLKNELDQRETPQTRVLSEIPDTIAAGNSGGEPENPHSNAPTEPDAQPGAEVPGSTPGDAEDDGVNSGNGSAADSPEKPESGDVSPGAQLDPVDPAPGEAADENTMGEDGSSILDADQPDPRDDQLQKCVPSGNKRIVLSRGHIDLFNVVSQNGKLVLNAKDDTSGRGPIERQPEDVIVHVNSHAKLTLPTGFANLLGRKANADFTTPIYFLGENGDDQGKVPFPGWDTSGVRPDFGAIDIEFMKVQGPGEVYMYTAGLGAPSAQLASQSFAVRSGEKIHQAFPAHVHTNWIFTKPGVYTMQMRAADASNSALTDLPVAAGALYTPGAGASNIATYTWYVGSNVPQELIDGCPVVDHPVDNNDNVVENPASEDSGKKDPAELSNEGLPSGQNGGAGSALPQNGVNAGGNGSAPKQAAQQRYVDAIYARIKDDRTQPAKWVDPTSLPFAIGNAGRAKMVETVGRIPAGSDVWMISSSQVQGVPWLGVNSQHPTLLAKTTGHLRLALTSFSGPGAMEVFYSSNFGGAGQRIFSGGNGTAGGAIVLNPNVHAHPNWVFSKAGTYRVGVTVSATLKNGQNISNRTVLTFNVGSANGVTNGHFDLGAEIGQALVGASGTTNLGGAKGGVLAAKANVPSLSNGSGLSASSDPLNGQSGVGAKALRGSQKGNFKDSFDVSASGSWWNTNTLLGVIIALLLVNAALSGVRLMQKRKQS
ncbi:TIGR03773 family transporter-associated surface protein [Arcanobacterium hippocoleae]|uniref:TIGR03773 family transporter-associated surface protein n=1 Tax=Arcanobacterium hippocoleae TaxID=149017 RepID=UPI003341286A